MVTGRRFNERALAKRSQFDFEGLTTGEIWQVVLESRAASEAVADFLQASDVLSQEPQVFIRSLQGLPGMGPARAARVLSVFLLMGRYQTSQTA